MLSLFRPLSIQGREPYLNAFVEKKTKKLTFALYSDIYRLIPLISFELGVMIEAKEFHSRSGGRNSSVGSVWARCPQRRGFDPPLGTFSGRGDFSLGVNMGSNSIPPKTRLDESLNRGLVCAYMHFTAQTQKILTFMS